MTITKSYVLLLAKIAPLIGVATVAASFQATVPGISEAWRVGLSTLLAAFVTLVGAIYHNVTNRLEVLEKAAKDDFVTRREYESRHGDMKSQLDRIETKIK